MQQGASEEKVEAVLTDSRKSPLLSQRERLDITGPESPVLDIPEAG